MKTAYFDCFNGISGDMTVGSFIDAGVDISVIRKGLAKLKISGYKVSADKVTRCGIAGTKFDVVINKGHGHRHIAYKDIKAIIEKSALSEGIKLLSKKIFETLACAEAKIHNVKPDRVRFHEVGDLDSIIDIVSTAIAVSELGIGRFYCINLNMGKGSVRSSHGILPLPAPAVLEILRGKPVSFVDVNHELVTPTGAAILATLVKDFEAMPEAKIDAIGYGAGTLILDDRPNLLRIAIGQATGADMPADQVIVAETNIDDMNPVSYGYLMEKLLEKGALDVYMTPVYMKKNRPGVLLTVITTAALKDDVVFTIMKETTSTGVRYYRADRQVLTRSFKAVNTKYGKVRVKVNTGPNGIITVSPEFEDCRRLALKKGVPFKTLYVEAQNKFSLK